MRARSGIAIALLVVGVVPAGAAARLEYRGAMLSQRQAEELMASALRAPGDSAALATSLEAFAARLEGLGYLDARVRAQWSEPAAGDLVLEVAEGRRYALSSVVLRAAPAEDSARFARALELAPGAWASPAAVGDAVERAVSRLVEAGYPYAELGVRGWEVDSTGVELVLAGVLGPRVTVTEIRIDGLAITRPEVARRAMGRLEGLPYRPDAAESARQRLLQLGLFRSVAFDGLEGAGDWSRGRLVYRVEEPRYNSFEGVVGTQGEAGTVGLGRLELGNLLGTGRAVGLGWESRGRDQSELAGRYLEPFVLGLPLRLELGLDQELRDSTYTRTRWGARGRFAVSTQEYVGAGFEQERIVQERGAVQEARIENTVFTLERTTLDDPIAPRRGTRVRLEATQSFKRETLRPPGSRSARASSVEARVEWIRPLRAGAALALELRGAGRFSSERVLPVFERFPLGGTETLRGFDEEQFRVDRYALSRLEWRWHLGAGRQRAFLFWDHAWAATRLAVDTGGERLERIDRDGIGAGLRLETAAGLAGIDYGLEAGRPPIEGKIHLRIVSTF